ncbi:hypothetical protein IAT38_000009 [Cryptococcus sp. DSM 104549]
MARQSRPFTASTASTSSKPKQKAARKQDPSNAYTYIPSLPKRHRTSAFQNSLTHEELVDSQDAARRRGGADGGKPRGRRGEDSEEEEESMADRVKRVAMMIAAEGPQEVDSDESEVESDDAWESGGSDDERWGDVFRELDKGKGGKNKKKAEVLMKPAKPLTVNLDESEDEAPKKKGKKVAKAPSPVSEEEESDDEELDDEDVEMSGSDGEEDDDGEDDDEEEEAEDDEDAGEDSSDEEDSDDEDLELDLSEDDADPDSLAGLDAFVDSLASGDKKRKASEDDEAAEAKKRRVLPVVAGLAIRDGDAPIKSNQKLDISSLISSHPSLSSASALLPSKTKKSSSILKSGVVPAPLATVAQERLDREAAYAQTKEEGQKWAGMMKRVKEAEHLSFPLQAKERGGVKTGNEVLADWRPQNDMESAVDSLLRRANLTEDALTKKEDLAMEAQEMTEEEIKERRAALRYQRELLFRAEAKAKRVAKIKSKTFRKLARKRAAKDKEGGLSLEELERLDPEAAEEERDRLERERAKERATLRHGAKSSRWARDVGGDGGELEDRRRAKEEMLDMKERLTRKIQGHGDGSSSEEESEDDEDEDDEAVKERAFDQLAQLDGQQPEEGGKKGLMQMAFMKKAQERQMKEVAQQEAEARRDIQLFGEDRAEDESGDGSGSEEEPEMINIGGNEGRMKFAGPTPGTSSTSAPAPIPTPAPTAPKPSAHKSALSRPRSPSPDVNPWLVASSGTAGPSRKRNALIGANAPAEDKATRALKKAGKARELAEEDERVDITVDGVVGAPTAKGKGKAKAAPVQVEVPQSAQVDEDSEEENELLPVKKGPRAFKQRELVAEAFAGDNVVEDFEAEKARQVEADAPQIEDTSLPGWGSWGGKGAKKKRTNPKFLVKTAGIEPTARKDFSRNNVIITEKKDKKASQFLIKDLPYPYTSKEQYEKSFAVPVGSEWNSRAGFQRGTLPRVVKKPGAIIEPVRRLF